MSQTSFSSPPVVHLQLKKGGVNLDVITLHNPWALPQVGQSISIDKPYAHHGRYIVLGWEWQLVLGPPAQLTRVLVIADQTLGLSEDPRDELA